MEILFIFMVILLCGKCRIMRCECCVTDLVGKAGCQETIYFVRALKLYIYVSCVTEW